MAIDYVYDVPLSEEDLNEMFKVCNKLKDKQK